MQKAIFIPGLPRFFLIAVTLITTIVTNAQSVAINNNGEAANNSSMLDVSSTTKGMLLPRMTSSQRSAINTPAEGLIVYDTDTRGFWYYNNNVWSEIPKSAGGGSLTLPFAGSVSFAGKVFSITNTNTSNGATGLHGKTDIGSGVNPAFTMGAWGDNSTGAGVAGTSNSGIGSYGFSFQNYGVYGYTTNASYSGIYGTHAGNGQGVKGEVSGTGAGVNGVSSAVNGIGVKGESTNGGYAVYGKNSTGSGIPVALTVGVWGDNSNGAGVVGTSNNGAGTYGYSVNNNGSYGFTSGIGYAGVYGTRINNGPAVMGDIYAAGYAIYGKSNSISGKAGLFENIHASGTDTVVKFISKGLGVNSYFINDNTNSTGALINGDQFGIGDGLLITSNKSNAARFYNKAGNSDTAITVAHDGTGMGVQISVNSASNTKDALNVVTKGAGNAVDFSINNPANSEAGLKLTTNGTGRGLQSTISNAANNSAAIYASSSGANGIQGYAFTTGVFGQSTSLTGGIGVFGQSSLNSGDGIGVKGISYSTVSTSGAITGINNANGIAVYAESTGGGTAVYGKTTKQNGAAIYGINDAQQGRGILGSVSGLDAVAIYGESSGTGSYAGFFRNSNAANTKDVVQIYNQGAGRGLMIDQVNSSNTDEVFEIRNSGTGNFLSLVAGNNDIKAYITKAGNIYTDASIIVRGNKGIVRNSNGNQLRVEEVSVNVPGIMYAHYDSDWGPGGQVINVTFNTPFAAPPIVLKGNTSSGGTLSGFSVEVYDVTTTGCKMSVLNWGPYDLERIAGVYKLIAIGLE